MPRPVLNTGGPERTTAEVKWGIPNYTKLQISKCAYFDHENDGSGVRDRTTEERDKTNLDNGIWNSGHSLCKGPGAGPDWTVGGIARWPVWLEQSG